LPPVQGEYWELAFADTAGEPARVGFAADPA
jgi:hypothetical protein